MDSKTTPAQYWREECWADRGYHFLRMDGDDAIWEHQGLRSVHTIRIKPDGTTENMGLVLKKPQLSEYSGPSNLGPCLFGLTAISAASNGTFRV